MGRGTANRANVAIAATASGGDTIAPSTNAAGHPSPGTSRSATNATATVLSTTSPIALPRIGRRLARNNVQSVDQPPLKSSGGKIERKIQSGAIVTRGKPGTNASAVPARTN